MTLMTFAEYARRIGKSRSAVAQMKTAGKLVLQGSSVDVEATEAWLKRYNRKGRPEVVDEDPSVKRGRPSVKQDGKSVKQSNLTVSTAQALNKSGQISTLGEVEEQLLALDWTQKFDWSPEAQDKRARLAAQCIGWEAVTSSAHDDGHWGGYQLRIPAYAKDGLHDGAIAGGFGFEMDAFDVLELIREHISIRRDEDGSLVQEDHDAIQVQTELLDLLARPFCETHKPKG